MSKNSAAASSGAPFDPDKKRLLPNAAFAVLQVVVASATLFLLYRYLLASQGVEALGVWSLVVAATSLANVSNLGLAGGTVRFVSKCLARNDEPGAAQAVETTTLSIAVVMGLAVFLLWPVSGWLLALVIPAKWSLAARELLPYTLAALWLSSLGGAVYSSLDGCHRADRRSLANIATQPLLLLLAVWFVPQHGLKGLAYAQILQYLVWLGVGWLLLKGQMPSLSPVPWRWSRSLFLQMWRYGLSFQLISILALLSEPLAKGLLSHFGTLSAVGYFEMANRLVSQLRALLVSANQVVVPYYSKVNETSRESIRGLYERNLSAIALLSSLAYSSLVAVLPLISHLWIGRLEPQFLLFAVMLSIGWYANTLVGPAYFANLGVGRLSHNLLGHAVQTAALAAFAVMGGIWGGAAGCAAALPLALIAGTVTILGAFHRAEDIPTRIVFPWANVKAMATGGVIALSGFASYSSVSSAIGSRGAIVVSVAILLVGWMLFLLLIPEARMFVARLNGGTVSSPRSRVEKVN